MTTEFKQVIDKMLDEMERTISTYSDVNMRASFFIIDVKHKFQRLRVEQKRAIMELVKQHTFSFKENEHLQAIVDDERHYDKKEREEAKTKIEHNCAMFNLYFLFYTSLVKKTGWKFSGI